MSCKATMKGVRLLLTAGAGGLIALGAQADFANKIGKSVAGYGETRNALANFPVLVRITSEQAQGCRDDGADLQFTSLDGKTVYPHEIDVWNPQGESTVWVRLPEMKNGTLFVMHWGDADYEGASFEKGAVWDAAGYAGVWHMTEESGPVANMTSKTAENGESLDAVPAGARASYSKRSAITAPIGYARDLGAEDVNHDVSGRAFLKVKSYDNLGLGDTYVISGWWNVQDFHGNYDRNHRTRNGRFFARKTSYNTNGGGFNLSFNNSLTASNLRGSGDKTYSPSIPSSDKKWVHMAFEFNGGKLTVYGNGKKIGTGDINAAGDNGCDLGIGSELGTNGSGEYSSDSYVVGLFDEVRLLDRNSEVNYEDWFAAEYAMGNDKSFLTEFEVSSGDEEIEISLRAPAMIYENDFEAQELIVSRPADRASGYQEVELVYTGDDDLVADFPSRVIFGAGRDTVAVPLKTIDNAERSGNRSFTVSIAEGEGYIVSETAGSVTVTVVDDESADTDVVWTGAANDLHWNNPKNWSPERVPTYLDNPRITSTGLSANDVITVSEDGRISTLIIETTTPFSIAKADLTSPKLTLNGVERRDVEGTEGNQAIAVPLRIYPKADNNCVWNIAGSGTFSLDAATEKAVDQVVFLKTGAGQLFLTVEGAVPSGALTVLAGEVKPRCTNAVRGNVTVGGGEEAAFVTFDQGWAYNLTPIVYTNGSFRAWADQTSGGVDNFNVHEGGYVYLKSTYGGKFDFWGGTMQIGYRVWSGTYGQHITAHKSDLTAKLNGNLESNGYYGYSITVEDGAQPIDLILTGSIDSGRADQTLTLSGAGTLKTTGGWGHNNSNVMRDLTWYMDNVRENGTFIGSGCGNGSLTVGGTATLAGIGRVCGNNDTQTLTVNGTLSPGSLTDDGEPIYGTFTAGSEAHATTVTLNASAKLKIGFGVGKDAETGRRTDLVDRLAVNGALTLAEGANLELAADAKTVSTIRGGTYTILTATGGITCFENLTVDAPKPSWKVNKVMGKVTTEDGEADAVVALTVTIPGSFIVIIR